MESILLAVAGGAAALLLGHGVIVLVYARAARGGAPAPCALRRRRGITMSLAMRAARLPLLTVLVGHLADPWPWDIGAQIQASLYAMLRFLTNVVFALDDALLGAARSALMLRNAVTHGGADMLGHLFHEMSPLWTVGLFAVLMALIVALASRFVITSQVTTAERFVLVTLLAGYLMVNGTYAVEWAEFMRHELGQLVYHVAYDAMQESVGPIPPGQVRVNPDCALSHDDPDTTLCTGYEFALSYLQFTDEEQVFQFGMPDAFAADYFSVPNAEFAGKPEAERNRLFDRAQQAPLQALGGVFLALMALLEEIVRVLLTVALLAAFTGLAVAIIVGAFLPLGHVFSGIVQQITQLFISTAVIEMLMGMLSGLLWSAQGNAVMFLSTGVLMLLGYVVLLFQSGSLVLRSFDAAMHGSVRLGAPEMLRVGGLDQLGRVASALQGSDAGSHAPRSDANVSAGAPGSASGLAAAQDAMNGAQPVVAAPASGGSTGTPVASGSSVATADSAASGGTPGVSAPAASDGAPTSTRASAASSGSGTLGTRTPAGADSATNAPAATGATQAASPASAASPVAPVYDPATGQVYDPVSGRSMSLAEYSAGGSEYVVGAQQFTPAPIPAAAPEFYGADEIEASWSRPVQEEREDVYANVDA